MNDDGRSSGPDDPLSRFLHADAGPLMFLREVLSSVLAVAMVGAVLFALSGVWPPMVAVESGSMEPHMHRGDLVFITEPVRYAPEFAVDGTGVVTYNIGENRGYTTFGSYGSVVVYSPPGGGGTPIIHRARLYVEEGENWVDRANPAYLGADSCDRVPACPAPYDGFITKGDANGQYDQVSGIAPVVKTEWIRGIARVRVPFLGYVRLVFSGASTTPLAPVTTADATDEVSTGETTAVTAEVTTSVPSAATVSGPGPARAGSAGLARAV